MRKLICTAAMTSVFWLLATSAPAMADAEPAASASSPAAALPPAPDTMCLKKAPKAGDADLRSGGKPPSINAVVLTQDAAGYQAKGFTAVQCPGAEKQAQFRESVCAVAERGNSYLRARWEKLFGDTPARLCASARAAVTLAIKLPPPTAPKAASAKPSSGTPAPEASPNN